jgi:hypothetical protein
VLADEENPAFVGGGFALVFPLLQRWESYSSPSELAVAFRTELGADHAVGESDSAAWMRANLVPVILAGLDGVAPSSPRGEDR